MLDLRKLIEETDTTGGKAFDLTIQSLIILSLISFSIETLPDLSSVSVLILNVIELVTVGIFTIEYIARVLVARRRLRFVLGFYGMIDLLAILPFYIMSGIDLRSVRVFRLFRLIRIMKIMRFSRAMHRFRDAFESIRAELTVFITAPHSFCCIFLVSASTISNTRRNLKTSNQSFIHCGGQ